MLDVLGDGEDETQSDVSGDVVRVGHAQPFSRIERPAVILDPQDQIPVFMDYPDIDGVAAVVLVEPVLHHVAGHFLHRQSGQVGTAGIDAPLFAESHDLLRDLYDFFCTAGAKIHPFI